MSSSKFLNSVTIAGSETVSGSEYVLQDLVVDGTVHAASVSAVGGLSANYAIFTSNVSGSQFYGDGSHLTSLNASNISSGTLAAARLPAFGGDITTTANDSASATVVKMQGYSISTATPSTGQMLQWSGTAWVPASIPSGGSGGGGVTYYLNYGLSANNPVAGLSGTHYELGRASTTLPLTGITTTNVSKASWDTLATFVTDHLDPDVIAIPAGIWDLNFWASSTASIQTQMTVRYQIYTYSEALSTTTLIATSDTQNLYDPLVVAQYVLSMVVPQTTIDINARIFLVLQAQATSNNKDITVYYNATRPTHLHTTIPSVGGSGLVKVVNGVFQNPAALLVDVDVADNAQINQTKIYGLTAALDSKFNNSGGVVGGDLTVTGTFSTINTDNWIDTYNTVSSTSGRWESVYTSTNNLSSNWNTTYSTVCAASARWESAYTDFNSNSASYVTLTGVQTLTNKTVIDWMTLVRGYNTTPSLCTTIANGDVYTYIYNSSPSNKAYFRYIATNGSEDSFYSYFSGSALSGLVATKSITVL